MASRNVAATLNSPGQPANFTRTTRRPRAAATAASSANEPGIWDASIPACDRNPDRDPALPGRPRAYGPEPGTRRPDLGVSDLRTIRRAGPRTRYLPALRRRPRSDRLQRLGWLRRGLRAVPGISRATRLPDRGTGRKPARRLVTDRRTLEDIRAHLDWWRQTATDLERSRRSNEHWAGVHMGELVEAIAGHHCAPSRSIQEALNSGDGTYRP